MVFRKLGVVWAGPGRHTVLFGQVTGWRGFHSSKGSGRGRWENGPGTDVTSISKITKDSFGPSVEVFNVFNSNSNPGSGSLKSSSLGP